MLKKSTIPISVMLLSLAVFSIVSIKTALAAGYVNVTNGYQILVNQGIVNLTAQTRSVNIDTSKATTSFFIPTKTVGEVDSYLSSNLHNIVKQGGDVTAPLLTYTAYSGTPASRVEFWLNEDGFYKAAYSTSGYPSEPGTAWIPISASVHTNFYVGDNYNTFYYFGIFYKDASNNSDITYASLTTAGDTTAPSITISRSPVLSQTNPPAYELDFYTDEVGQYGYVWSTSPAHPAPTINQNINAYQTKTVYIGDTANTGYYYDICARDSSLNTSCHSNYLVTSTDTTAPVLSNISYKINVPPKAEITFDSDEAGEFAIVFAAKEVDLAAPTNWASMSAGNNHGTAGDEQVNTNFYYIIYARDSLGNTSHSGILTVGNPGGGDADGNPEITILGVSTNPATAPAKEVVFGSDMRDDSLYQIVWSQDPEVVDKILPDLRHYGILMRPGLEYTELVGDREFTHYFYKIYTASVGDPDTVSGETNLLELDTDAAR